MLTTMYSQNWASGRWIPAGYSSPSVGNSLSDIYGQTLAVGAVVKFIGTITAMKPTDPHFQDIEVTPMFPQSSLVEANAGVYPQNIPVKKFYFHPLQLIKVGSENRL